MGDNKIIHTKVISGENKTKALVLGVVLDATLSFSVVYGQIYYLIEHLLINLKKLKKDKCDIDISYSVVLLHDKPENMRFSGKDQFQKMRMRYSEALQISHFMVEVMMDMKNLILR